MWIYIYKRIFSKSYHSNLYEREKESNIPCALLSRNHPRQNTHTKLYCTYIAIDTCNCTSCASEKVQVVYTSVCPPVIAVIYLYFWGSNNSLYFLFLISDRGGKERGKQIFEFLKKKPKQNDSCMFTYVFGPNRKWSVRSQGVYNPLRGTIWSIWLDYCGGLWIKGEI